MEKPRHVISKLLIRFNFPGLSSPPFEIQSFVLGSAAKERVQTGAETLEPSQQTAQHIFNEY